MSCEEAKSPGSTTLVEQDLVGHYDQFCYICILRILPISSVLKQDSCHVIEPSSLSHLSIRCQGTDLNEYRDILYPR